jgi:hypothetical protein
MDARVEPAHYEEERAKLHRSWPFALRHPPYWAKQEAKTYPAAILAITAMDGGK